MIKKGDSLGQFYLISAVVLAILAIGIFTISNYSKKEPNTKLDYLKEEIQIESTYVIDYGLYNRLNEKDFYGLLLNFTENYIDLQKKDIDLYFVFGNKDNLTVNGYQKTEKPISVSSGSSYTTITNAAGNFVGGINPETNALNLSIDNTQYKFEFNKGRFFYFILSQKINRGNHIVVG